MRKKVATVKLPRDIAADRLVRVLEELGYLVESPCRIIAH
jgi:hypothetical protein